MLATRNSINYKAANDSIAPGPSRRAAIVILPSEPKPVWHILAAGFLLACLSLTALSIWVMYKGSLAPIIAMAPLQSFPSVPLDIELVGNEKPKTPAPPPAAALVAVAPQPNAPVTLPVPTLSSTSLTPMNDTTAMDVVPLPLAKGKTIIINPVPRVVPVETAPVTPNAETTNTQSTTVTLPPPPTKNISMTDIVLPALSLEPPAPPSAEQITDQISAQISSLPALQKVTAVHVESAETNALEDQMSRANGEANEARYDEALAIYNQILAKNAYNHQAQTGKIYALAKKGDLPQAIEVSQKALTMYPHDDVIEANLGEILAQSGRNDEAIRYYDRAARDAPSNMNYRLSLATLYDRTNHRAQALMLYRQIAADAQKRDLPNFPLGNILDRISYLESLGSSK